MSEESKKQDEKGLSRRNFVATGAAVAAGAGLGMFGGKAPAYAQSRTLNILEWSSFIKEADVLTDQQAAEFGKMEGINVRVEHINLNGMNARATAAVESKTGPDVLRLHNNFPQLYAEGMADHSDLISEIGESKVWPAMKDAVRSGGRYVGMPTFATTGAWVYRRDFFEEAGVNAPQTWDDFIENVGPKLKALGYPVGQALGHSFGDPNGFCYMFLWSHGGKVVDENGKLAIDSKETRHAVSRLVDFYKGSCDETGLGWDDGSNNRAFFAETISTTLNGASIYFVAKRNWDNDQNPLRWKCHHFLNPVGPAGRRFHGATQFHSCVTKYSPVQSAAKNYIRYILQQKQQDDFMWTNNGYVHAPTAELDDHPVWDSDPALTPFKDSMQYVVHQGYPGPFDRKSSELLSKYIVVDMFARAAKGDSVESTVKQATSELKQIYT